MSDTVMLAFIASIAPTIAAIAAMVIGLRNTRETKKVEAKTDTIIEKAAEIHTLTNSNLSAVTKALELAQAEIGSLKQLMAQMTAATSEALRVKTAADLHAATMMQPPTMAELPPTPLPITGDSKVLDAIENNTAKTADGVSKLTNQKK